MAKIISHDNKSDVVKTVFSGTLAECQAKLNEWINEYVVMGCEIKKMYPVINVKLITGKNTMLANHHIGFWIES
jgi:hypothetical protein